MGISRDTSTYGKVRGPHLVCGDYTTIKGLHGLTYGDFFFALQYMGYMGDYTTQLYGDNKPTHVI